MRSWKAATRETAGRRKVSSFDGYEVLTAMVMKRSTSSPLKANRCFGVTFGLHLQE
jgi:hypothetical protein